MNATASRIAATLLATTALAGMGLAESNEPDLSENFSLSAMISDVTVNGDQSKLRETINQRSDNRLDPFIIVMQEMSQAAAPGILKYRKETRERLGNPRLAIGLHGDVAHEMSGIADYLNKTPKQNVATGFTMLVLGRETMAEAMNMAVDEDGTVTYRSAARAFGYVIYQARNPFTSFESMQKGILETRISGGVNPTTIRNWYTQTTNEDLKPVIAFVYRPWLTSAATSSPRPGT